MRASAILPILLAGCAAVQSPLLAEGGEMLHGAVPFADGRTLTIDADHKLVWIDAPFAGRQARTIRPAVVGEPVTVRTWDGDTPGVVTQAWDGGAVLWLDADAWLGMSGCGAWADDETIIGIVQARHRYWRRLVLIEAPEEELPDFVSVARSVYRDTSWSAVFSPDCDPRSTCRDGRGELPCAANSRP